MSELDDLKKRWRSVSIDAPQPSGLPGPEGCNRLTKTRSAKERMLRRYRMMLVIIMFSILDGTLLQRLVDISWWVMLYYYMYMVLAGVMNFMQMHKLSATDVVNLPVIDAITFLKRFSRLRTIIKTVMLTTGLPMIVLLIYSMEHDDGTQLMLAGLIGAIIGGIIGLLIDLRFRADIKAMQEFLDTSLPVDEN